MCTAHFTVPVPFYTSSDHLGKVAGGESRNREVKGREPGGERWTKANVNNENGKRIKKKDIFIRETVKLFFLVLQFTLRRVHRGTPILHVTVFDRT